MSEDVVFAIRVSNPVFNLAVVPIDFRIERREIFVTTRREACFNITPEIKVPR